MKKVGLITFHSSHNYGAMLQAYALQKTFLDLGVDCKIIHYRTPKMVNDYAIFKKGKSPRTIAKNVLNVLRYGAFKRKHKRFENFIQENLVITRRYSSLAELLLSPPGMDLYVTGSDQVWNGVGVLKDAYFLPFAEKNSKKVSYAASFGDNMPNEKNTKRIAMYLKDFAKISVREEAAKEYLEECVGVECCQTPDPVFLLKKQEWLGFTESVSEKTPYIFCYCLVKESRIQQVIDEIKKRTGLKVVTLSDGIKPNIKANRVYYDAGPKEFLSLLKGAAFVVTDSFHGTAFSLLLEKQFISVARKNRSKRIDSLLKQFGEQKRFISNSSEIDLTSIEYQEKKGVFDNLRNIGLRYIQLCVNEDKM